MLFTYLNNATAKEIFCLVEGTCLLVFLENYGNCYLPHSIVHQLEFLLLYFSVQHMQNNIFGTIFCLEFPSKSRLTQIM